MSLAHAQRALRPSGWRGLLQRFIGRLSHGLVTQEILDRLARLGLVVYPYFIALEPAPEVPDAAPDALCSIRMLGLADSPEIISISLEDMTEAQIATLLARGIGCGVFHDGKLAGYTWANTDCLPVPGSRGKLLFLLQPDEAYLHSIFVALPYRGLRLAGYLRQSMQQELAWRGRTRLYSVSLFFNRSSRRFKSRLGVHEAELRLYVHLRLRSLRGLDLRLWRWSPQLRSPRLKRIAAPLASDPRD